MNSYKYGQTIIISSIEGLDIKDSKSKRVFIADGYEDGVLCVKNEDLLKYKNGEEFRLTWWPKHRALGKDVPHILEFNAELYEDCSFVGMWNFQGQLFSDSYKIENGKLYVFGEEFDQWTNYDSNNDNDMVLFGPDFERFDLKTKLLDLDEVIKARHYKSATKIIRDLVGRGENFNDLVRGMLERHPVSVTNIIIGNLSDDGELKYEL